MSQLEEQILKQNVLEEHRQVHELQVRIKELRADVERYVAINAQQVERAKKAEAELAMLREQEPAWYRHDNGTMWAGSLDYPKLRPEGFQPLYAAPVPAPAVPDGDDFNGTTPHLILCMEALVRLDADGVLVPHGIGRDASKLLSAAANRLRQQPAPAVPEEWREVMAELAADLQACIEAEHAYRDQYSSVMRKYQNDMRIVERARALLQSAEGYSSQAQREVHHD